MDKEKAIKVLQMVADNTEKDAKRFEGAAFNGRTVSEYLGCQGAGIKALADIFRQYLQEE